MAVRWGCSDWRVRPITAVRSIQGAEGDLVAGGRETLARTKYVYTECFDDELYEGAPTRVALLDMLPGFEVVKLYESDILLRNAALTSP
jgi:hypothetical protein